MIVACLQNVHQGYPRGTLVRFLKAREWSVPRAHKMLMDSLNWRIQNEIDSMLAGQPVYAFGVGLSTFDKASVGRHVTVILINRIAIMQMLTMITSVDDLNYPEKTETYYIVNAPYVFSACWKVVKPLLQERTKKKIQVLHGSGRDELLKVIDYESLPHFCKREGSGSSRDSFDGVDCYSYDHPFHQQLYNYMKQQAVKQDVVVKQESFHVDLPTPKLEEVKIAKTIESEIHHLRGHNGLSHQFNSIKIEGP
ncbi:hypothetical protein PR202_ga29922 [Eleusine coracana subsp. coracana]|uniref:CRAL-TRIO domain-containing protein n=1 Tax=Eleusine coracana subsp. coracana TaxID=191504 RepID=A0AAV5DP86_ELECO|nr:hypothetical protein PR202_ga29922 [Eleusine coracana subsp. coracana]